VNKFGWCHDELHEACKVSYTMMWPPSDLMEKKTKKSKKDETVQEEKKFSCECECHA